jgi:hypothetical protein
VTSWHGFAEAILAESRKLGGPWPRLQAITTEEYPTPAQRTGDSRLDCTALAAFRCNTAPLGRRSRPSRQATIICLRCRHTDLMITALAPLTPPLLRHVLRRADALRVA